MQHVWSVFCRTAVTDRNSNAVSLFECLDSVSAQVHSPRPPSDVPLLSKLVTLWRRSDKDAAERGSVRILIEGPDGRKLNELTYEVDLSEHVASRAFVEIAGVPYGGNGVYEFIVKVEDEDTEEDREVARVPVEIELDHLPTQADA